jgi:hypothetical protein
LSSLYPKDGAPLTVRVDDIFDRSGSHVGRRRGSKVYGLDGRYAGTEARAYEAGRVQPCGDPRCSTSKASTPGTTTSTNAGMSLV